MLGFSLAGTSVVTGSVLTESLNGRVVTPISLGIMLICLFPFYGVRSVCTAARLKKRDGLNQWAGGGFIILSMLLIGWQSQQRRQL